MSRKTNQRNRAKKTFYSSCEKTCRCNINFMQSVLEKGVYFKNITNFDKKQVILVITALTELKKKIKLDIQRL